MSLGWWWCKKCQWYSKMQECETPYLTGCDHDVDEDIDYDRFSFNFDDDYSEWMSERKKRLGLGGPIRACPII